MANKIVGTNWVFKDKKTGGVLPLFKEASEEHKQEAKREKEIKFLQLMGSKDPLPLHSGTRTIRVRGDDITERMKSQAKNQQARMVHPQERNIHPHFYASRAKTLNDPHASQKLILSKDVDVESILNSVDRSITTPLNPEEVKLTFDTPGATFQGGKVSGFSIRDFNEKNSVNWPLRTSLNTYFNPKIGATGKYIPNIYTSYYVQRSNDYILHGAKNDIYGIGKTEHINDELDFAKKYHMAMSSIPTCTKTGKKCGAAIMYASMNGGKLKEELKGKGGVIQPRHRTWSQTFKALNGREPTEEEIKKYGK